MVIKVTSAASRSSTIMALISKLDAKLSGVVPRGDKMKLQAEVVKWK